MIADRSEVWKRLIHPRTWITPCIFGSLVEYCAPTSCSKYSIPTTQIFWLSQASIITPCTISGHVFTWTWNLIFYFFNQIYLFEQILPKTLDRIFLLLKITTYWSNIFLMDSNYWPNRNSLVQEWILSFWWQTLN